jgi:hypothetical protein
MKRRVSLVLSALLISGLGLYSVAMGGYALWVQHSGVATYVEIGHCSKHTWRRAPTTCTASWQQTDGTQKTVTVHSNVTEVRAVNVHIRGDQAYTSSYPGWWQLLIGIALLGLTPVLFYGNRRARSRRSRASRTDDPGMTPTSEFLPPP